MSGQAAMYVGTPTTIVLSVMSFQVRTEYLGGSDDKRPSPSVSKRLVSSCSCTNQRSGISSISGIYPFVVSVTVLRRGESSSVQQPAQSSIMLIHSNLSFSRDCSFSKASICCQGYGEESSGKSERTCPCIPIYILHRELWQNKKNWPLW